MRQCDVPSVIKAASGPVAGSGLTCRPNAEARETGPTLAEPNREKAFGVQRCPGDRPPAEAGSLSEDFLNAGTVEGALFADIISRISFCSRIVGLPP